MKYIKTYEDLNDEPQIGDYVVCSEEGKEDILPEDNSYGVYEFTSNNVGQYVKYRGSVQHFKYLIKYEDLPEELRWSFYDDEENCRRMAKKEILFWSKDKEACEAYLAAKKYNL